MLTALVICALLPLLAGRPSESFNTLRAPRISLDGSHLSELSMGANKAAPGSGNDFLGPSVSSRVSVSSPESSSLGLSSFIFSASLPGFSSILSKSVWLEVPASCPRLKVCFLTTFLSAFSTSGLLGNIFLRAGGVTSRGMSDLFSVVGEFNFGDLEESSVFLCSPGENFGIKLFLSPAV